MTDGEIINALEAAGVRYAGPGARSAAREFAEFILRCTSARDVEGLVLVLERMLRDDGWRADRRLGGACSATSD